MTGWGMPRRAVVVGGGLAGLLAARALLDSCEEVVLVERDEALGTGEVRRGLPHGGHLHNLLGRAQQEIEHLAPASLPALRNIGCGVVSVADATHVYEFGLLMPKRPLGLTIHAAERRHIDQALCRVICSDERIDVRTGTTLVEIELDRGAVRAVELLGPTGTSRMHTDLLVLATGANSSGAVRNLLHAPRVPRETRSSGRWYATAMVRFEAEAQAWMSFPSAHDSRGALLSPAGGDRWMLSVNGLDDVRHPRTREDVHSFIRTLPDPAIHERMSSADIMDEPRVYRRSEAVWRRFEHSELPAGLTFLGDVVAALDPLLGQGASVAAWQATRLGLLAGEGLSAAELALRHRNAAAACVAAVWDIGRRVEDAIVETVGGVGPFEAFAARLADDESLHRRYVRVWHLLDDVDELRNHLA